MRPITVLGYAPAWPEILRRLHGPLWPARDDLALSIEHVGSTAVPALSAKPIIDATVVVERHAAMQAVIERLADLGYTHLGTLGIPEREAFEGPGSSLPRNLHACPQGSVSLANHLIVRDVLRRDAGAAAEHAMLKKQLALNFSRDMDGYVTGKTDFLPGLFRDAGLRRERLEARANATRRAV